MLVLFSVVSLFTARITAQCADYEAYCITKTNENGAGDLTYYGAYFDVTDDTGTQDSCAVFYNPITGDYLFWDEYPSLGWIISPEIGSGQWGAQTIGYCNQQTYHNLDTCGQGTWDSFDYWQVRGSTNTYGFYKNITVIQLTESAKSKYSYCNVTFVDTAVKQGVLRTITVIFIVFMLLL